MHRRCSNDVNKHIAHKSQRCYTSHWSETQLLFYGKIFHLKHIVAKLLNSRQRCCDCEGARQPKSRQFSSGKSKIVGMFLFLWKSKIFSYHIVLHHQEACSQILRKLTCSLTAQAVDGTKYIEALKRQLSNTVPYTRLLAQYTVISACSHVCSSVVMCSSCSGR